MNRFSFNIMQIVPPYISNDIHHGGIFNENIELLVENEINRLQTGQQLANTLFNRYVFDEELINLHTLDSGLFFEDIPEEDINNIDFSNDHPRHPLSDDIFRRLKVVNYCDIVRASTTECSICLDKFNDTDKVIVLKCKHYFHKNCIEKWFEEQSTCPICRNKVS